MSVPSISSTNPNAGKSNIQEQKIMMTLSELLMRENLITAHENLELSNLIRKGSPS